MADGSLVQVLDAPKKENPMPEPEEYVDEQPELVVHRVADPQDDGSDPIADTADQALGTQARTRAGGLMDQGQM